MRLAFASGDGPISPAVDALPTLIAACAPGGSPKPDPIAGTTGERSCPPTEAIRMALWSDASGERGVPETPHWQVHLRDDIESYSEDDARAPVWSEGLGPRTEAQVREREPGPLGSDAWILLTESTGVYGVYEVSGGVLAGRTVQWYWPHEEDGDWFTMAPYCGP